MKKVFLGGTCNGSLWRNELIKQLRIDYFNPCGEIWTEEMMEEEIRQRKACDFCLYVITPKMTGMYSIAEVADDSNKQPDKTIFCYLINDEDSTFTDFQIKSLEQIGKLVKNNGANFFKTLEEAASFLNNQ